MGSKVYVWDLFVRCFHWSLVALFLTSYLTGEDEHWLHSYSGYAIFVLVSLRILWGFVGSKYARFKEFVHSPSTILGYLKSIVSGSPKRFLGHNPAGGAMVLALLLSLVMVTVSGMKLYAIEEGKGPFAQGISVGVVSAAYADDDEYESDDKYHYEEDEDHYSSKEYYEHEGHDEEAEEFWEEIHEVFVNLLLLLILLHVIGVFVASRQHDESLVKSMLTGYKEEK